MNYKRIRALSTLAILSVPVAGQAQDAAIAAAVTPVAVAPVAVAPVAAVPVAAASVAPPPTLWRFLGIPQTARALRNGLVNRRGNLPGLERKPPLVPIAAPENLESPNPAIKAAAEIKQAEDMKKQKIKAIKYLASIGCGCYDKDGAVTDALLAGTDDCTPDVRLAVIEAIEDNVNMECCKRCGTMSCCNEKTSKRLSEMAYELDDSGCPIEPSAEIRRAAARVLKKCCPGGPPSGPIEEEYIPMEPAEDVQMIPAPAPVVDEPAQRQPQVQGETGNDDFNIRGESGEDDRELNERPFRGDAPEKLDAPEAEAEDLIFRRSVKIDVAAPLPATIGTISTDVDASSIRLSDQMPLANPISTPVSEAKPVTVLSAPVVSVSNIKDFGRMLESTEVVDVPAKTIERKAVRRPAVQKQQAPRQPAVGTVAVQSYAALPEPTSASSNPGQTNSAASTPMPRYQAVSEVAFVNRQTGDVMLKSSQLKAITPGTIGYVFQSTPRGPVKIGTLTIRVTGRSTGMGEVSDRTLLGTIQAGDQVVCP